MDAIIEPRIEPSESFASEAAGARVVVINDGARSLTPLARLLHDAGALTRIGGADASSIAEWRCFDPHVVLIAKGAARPALLAQFRTDERLRWSSIAVIDPTQGIEAAMTSAIGPLLTGVSRDGAVDDYVNLVVAQVRLDLRTIGPYRAVRLLGRRPERLMFRTPNSASRPLLMVGTDRVWVPSDVPRDGALGLITRLPARIDVQRMRAAPFDWNDHPLSLVLDQSELPSGVYSRGPTLDRRRA